jgi:hypothetical protein
MRMGAPYRASIEAGLQDMGDVIGESPAHATSTR